MGARMAAGTEFIRLDTAGPETTGADRDPGRNSGRDPGPGTARQVALVPGAAAPVLALDLPAGLTGATREAVARRQVGDMLGVDAVEMRPFHPALAGKGRGGKARDNKARDNKDGAGWRRALVAGRADVARWRAAAPGVRAVLPDYLALPTSEGLWTLAVDADGVRARLGPGDGFAAAPEVAQALIAAALEDGPAPRAIWLMEGAWPALAALAGTIPVVRDAAALAEHGVAAPVVLGHGELAFDLRRDPAVALSQVRARLAPWRWPVLAGLLAAALWAAAEWQRGTILARQAAVLEAEALALTREHFTGAAPVLDIRAQVARILAEAEAARGGGAAAGDPGPLALLARAAEVMVASGAAVREVVYAPEGGLRVTLGMEDFAAVDRLEAALEAGGIAVAVDRSETGAESGVEARMTLSAAAPAAGTPGTPGTPGAPGAPAEAGQ